MELLVDETGTGSSLRGKLLPLYRYYIQSLNDNVRNLFSNGPPRISICHQRAMHKRKKARLF